VTSVTHVTSEEKLCRNLCCFVCVTCDKVSLFFLNFNDFFYINISLVRKNCVISPQKVIRIPSMHCELDGNAQGIVNRLLQFLRKRVMNPFF